MTRLGRSLCGTVQQSWSVLQLTQNRSNKNIISRPRRLIRFSTAAKKVSLDHIDPFNDNIQTGELELKGPRKEYWWTGKVPICGF